MAVTDAEVNGDGDEIRVGIPFRDLHFSIFIILRSHYLKKVFMGCLHTVMKLFCENMMFAILLFHTFGFALCFLM